MVLVACFGQGVGVHRGENQEKKGCWWKGDEGPRSHNPFRESHRESLVGLEIILTKIKIAWNFFQAIDFIWCPQRDLNSCCRRERPVSWARLDDGDVSLVGRVGFEPTTLCLKGRYSTS